jgi:5-methylcytosine-specific restriction endonuclease McrA
MIPYLWDAGQTGLSGAADQAIRDDRTGASEKMLKKVKRIKLGIRAYCRIMKRVLERDDWRCQKCGSLENLPIHPQIKRNHLGNDALANLITLCAPCHASQHGQLYFERTARKSSAKKNSPVEQ